MCVALYTRVSNKDKGQETENQLTQQRQWFKQNDYAVTQEYIDHEGGTSSHREQFKTASLLMRDSASLI